MKIWRYYKLHTYDRNLKQISTQRHTLLKIVRFILFYSFLFL